MASTFTPGAAVVTRRGKRGTVVSSTETEVMVRFGGKIFPMRPGQLVTASAYESMQTAGRVSASNQRYNSR